MDISKTVATTLGKDDGYSNRSEVTGKDGAELPTPIMIINRDIQGNDSNETNSSTN